MITPRTGIVVWFATLDAVQSAAVLAIWGARMGNGSPEPVGVSESSSEAAARHGERRAAYALLRLLLAKEVGRECAALPIMRTPGGKPRLAGADIAFNLSRSGDLLAIGLSGVGPVGIDIERRRPIKAAPHRQARIVAAGEAIASGRALPVAPEDAEASYLQAWVRLEALAKATGEGIGTLLTRLGIIGGAAQTAAQPGEAWRIEDLEPGDGLFAALACPRSQGCVTAHWLPADIAAFFADPHGLRHRPSG
ncbi:MAG: hypothetical protein R3D68_14880 [Hyphomicrobiaceae bacterium]